ncbi:Mono- and diacylglycerol lipase [Cyphellophora attinorum]|uniref:Mono-and diacylglycerol lipase n=1 Tax=Cyphellophora attinorum TaxID=1664694 RepID=A0A0N1HHY3_9EURO|nr:Mono- and diacylglycerol lipase [Phialophora attinorum]KPI45753.1 Mono- and diacylglycerol lipase [Phialophora attinorum]
MPAQPIPPVNSLNISRPLFESLEELARIVDISYCVGSTGISKPFKCMGRCSEFEGFELVTTWNTGPLLSDSCGYVALSHEPFQKRVIVAFRGTYSIANTIADLSTTPAEYMPFPADSDHDEVCTQAQAENNKQSLLPQLVKQNKRDLKGPRCDNCTVHTGFMTSWRNTRCTIIPHVEKALNDNPGYELTLVGHSLGGAVAALAALEFQARGWQPKRFNLHATSPENALYRRVTHANDPVPLLPLEEWGYFMHAGEIFIEKEALPPAPENLRVCRGDEDIECIAGGVASQVGEDDFVEMRLQDGSTVKTLWGIGKRYRLWELFFAHRDYFWRLGLCVPGGDPWDWGRGKYDHEESVRGNDEEGDEL